jgi:hypothetical protein
MYCKYRQPSHVPARTAAEAWGLRSPARLFTFHVSICVSAHAGQLRALKALWQQLALRPNDLPAFLAACPDVGRLQVMTTRPAGIVDY